MSKNSSTSPAHYKAGGLEVVDIWRKKLTHEEFCGACKANILKYVLRSDLKNGVEDLEKAQVYLKWLIEAKKKEEEKNENSDSEHLSNSEPSNV